MSQKTTANFVELAAELLDQDKDCLMQLCELELISMTHRRMFLILHSWPKFKENRTKAEAIAEMAKYADVEEGYVRSVISNYPQYMVRYRFSEVQKRIKKTKSKP